MGRIFGFILVSVLLCADALGAARVARTTGRAAKYIDPNSYSYMYPYMSNKMRTELNPGVTVSQTNNPIDVLVRTEEMAPPRRVVPRPQYNSTARTATTTNVARAASTNTNSTTTTRRVVPRKNTNNVARATMDTDRVYIGGTAVVTPVSGVAGNVSTPRCFADYTSCMDRYCERSDMAYNHCFCSSKLTQIDSTYQPRITELMSELIRLRGVHQWTDEEMTEYWMDVVGNYSGGNSWQDLENALNITWPSPEERMSGQNAFLIGHQYCVQHLSACASMSSNLRDAYVSKISRDCQTYEAGLVKIKNAVERLIEYYSD